jgi:DNA-binding helix-hairpin-helix protein with protein kinase domain
MSVETAMALATGQPTVTPVAPVEVISEAPKVEAPLESTRFTHLAKKEAELVKQREEFKRERDFINAEKEKLKPIHEKLSQFEQLKKTDPVAAIKMLEFTDEDFVNYMASREDNSSPEEKARKAALDEINKFTSEQKKREDEVREATNNKIINEFKDSITKAISSDKEKYELSNVVGKQAEELAFDFVTECVKLGIEPPNAEEAADYVEKYYEDYFKGIMTTKKLTPKEAVAAAKEAIAAPDAPLKAEVNPRPTSKTLSNKSGATVASTVTRRESASEKRERLIQKLANGG